MSSPAPIARIASSPLSGEKEKVPTLDDFASIPLNGKSALISGITGQDGSYLAELLLAKVRHLTVGARVGRCAHALPPQGYIVHGLIRRSSSFNTGRIEHLYKDRHGDSVRTWLGISNAHADRGARV